MALTLVAMFATSAAVAADDGAGKARKSAKGGKKKKKEKKPEGPNMDSNDPVHKEQSDEGRYAPTGVTGELKAQQEAEVAKTKVEKPYIPPPRDRFVVFGDLLFGFGRAPRPGPARAAETTDSTVLALVVGASYDVFPTFTAGVRVPWSTASMELPNRTQSEQEMAFGSPEILGEYRVKLSRVTTIPILIAVGIPLAQGNSDPNASDPIDLRRATVNLLADAAGGWRDGELYGTQRLPVTLGVGVRYRSPAWEFHAYDKIVAGIDTGATVRPPQQPDPGGGALVVKDTSLRNVTLVGFTYELLDKPSLWAGLDGWLVYTLIEPLPYESSATDPTPFQVVAEPRAGLRFGKLRPSLGLVFPIGGRLADSGISGIRLHVDYAL